MTAKEPGIKGGRRAWEPRGRVFKGREHDDSGGERKTLAGALADIAKVERAEAAVRQFEAGIKEPIKTDFKHGDDAELESALAKIWDAGPKSKNLYVKIGKGLTCLTRIDVTALRWLSGEEIESIAGALAAGKTLKEAAE